MRHVESTLEGGLRTFTAAPPPICSPVRKNLKPYVGLAIPSRLGGSFIGSFPRLCMGLTISPAETGSSYVDLHRRLQMLLEGDYDRLRAGFLQMLHLGRFHQTSSTVAMRSHRQKRAVPLTHQECLRDSLKALTPEVPLIEAASVWQEVSSLFPNARSIS